MDVNQPAAMARPEAGSLLDSGAGQASPWRLDQAVNGLRRMQPEFSASQSITRVQFRVLVFLGIAGVTAGAAAPEVAGRLALSLLATAFAMITLIRILALWHMVWPNTARTANEKRAVPKHDLPPYALLVPLYREASVAAGLVSAMLALDYPASQLEIMFLTEADDNETRAALTAAGLGRHMRIVTVPDGAPRTKPRALNFGLTFARGEFVGIYDAEDVPDPGQLQAAVDAFRSTGPEIACVQARLGIYNPGRNFLTRGIMARTPRE